MESAMSDGPDRREVRDEIPLLPVPQLTASIPRRSSAHSLGRLSHPRDTSALGTYTQLSESLTLDSHTAPAVSIESLHDDTGTMRDAPEGTSAYDPFLTGFDANELTLRNVLAAWGLELTSIFIAIAMFCSIIGTVYPYDGKPLPQWPFELSINALVSAFVVVLKICLVLVLSEGLGQLKWLWFRRTRPLHDIQTYDDASRGPLGAAKLIWLLKGKHVLSTMAAAMIIVLLVIDPLSQLLIQYNTCEVLDPGSTSSIPKSSSFAFRLDGPRAGKLGPPFEMQALMNAGVFNPDIPHVKFDCPTGNCAFHGEYKSVAYCSTCVDISDQIIVDNETDQGLQYLLPSGIATEGIVSGSIQLMAGPYDEGMEFLFVNGRRTPGKTCESNTWDCNGIGAVRCRLGQCIRTFTSAVRGGSLVEQTLDKGATDSMHWGQGQRLYETDETGTIPWLSTIDLECIGSDGASALRQQGYAVSLGDRFLAYNASYLPNSALPFNSSCIYQYSLEAQMSLDGFWSTFFGDSAGLSRFSMSGSSVLRHIIRVGDYNVTFDRIERTLENLTSAMTTYMRENGVQNYSSPFLGQVTKVETCARVNWPWITFPAVLIVVVCLFFVLMVFETRKLEGGAGFYKSSVLPLLFHGLDHDRDVSLVNLENAFVRQSKRMEKEAQRLRVRLVDTKDRGLQFVQSPSK